MFAVCSRRVDCDLRTVAVEQISPDRPQGHDKPRREELAERAKTKEVAKRGVEQMCQSEEESE